jgi:hypothetical protein
MQKQQTLSPSVKQGYVFRLCANVGSNKPLSFNVSQHIFELPALKKNVIAEHINYILSCSLSNVPVIKLCTAFVNIQLQTYRHQKTSNL